MVQGTGKNGKSDQDNTPQIVYVTFTGEDRATSGGLPIVTDGWWEIHGLPFRTGLEVAYALADDPHISVRARPDMPWESLTGGCTYMFLAGRPSDEWSSKSVQARMN